VASKNCRELKLSKSDMSPSKRPQFLAYRATKFLDTSCHQNVTINANFAQISGVHEPLFGVRTYFSGFKSFSMSYVNSLIMNFSGTSRIAG